MEEELPIKHPKSKRSKWKYIFVLSPVLRILVLAWLISVEKYIACFLLRKNPTNLRQPQISIGKSQHNMPFVHDIFLSSSFLVTSKHPPLLCSFGRNVEAESPGTGDMGVPCHMGHGTWGSKPEALWRRPCKHKIPSPIPAPRTSAPRTRHTYSFIHFLPAYFFNKWVFIGRKVPCLVYVISGCWWLEDHTTSHTTPPLTHARMNIAVYVVKNKTRTKGQRSLGFVCVPPPPRDKQVLLNSFNFINDNFSRIKCFHRHTLHNNKYIQVFVFFLTRACFLVCLGLLLASSPEEQEALIPRQQEAAANVSAYPCVRRCLGVGLYRCECMRMYMYL